MEYLSDQQVPQLVKNEAEQHDYDDCPEHHGGTASGGAYIDDEAQAVLSVGCLYHGAVCPANAIHHKERTEY